MSQNETFFRVITDGNGNFLVWETGRRLPPHWSDTPYRGSLSEMLAAIRTLIAETSPTPMHISRRTVDSAWQDTVR